MKITAVDTYPLSAGWNNWLLLQVHTDAGIHGIGKGTLHGFLRTTEAAVRELEHLAVGQDPRPSLRPPGVPQHLPGGLGKAPGPAAWRETLKSLLPA